MGSVINNAIHGGSSAKSVRLIGQAIDASTSQSVTEIVMPNRTFLFPSRQFEVGDSVEITYSYSMPAVGSVTRTQRVRLGAEGSGASGDIIHSLNGTTSQTINSTTSISRLMFIVENGTQLSTHIGNSSAYPVNSSSAFLSVSANIAAPIEFNVTGTSALETAVTITAATWAAGVATYTTSAAHGFAVLDKVTVAGITPAAWDVANAIITTVPTTTTFTVPLADPVAAYTSGGTVQRTSNIISRCISIVQFRPE